MSILVTGAGGFIGRELLSALLDRGQDKIVAVDQDLGTVADHPRVIKVAADIVEREAMGPLFDGSIDAVIHLAALPGGASERDPLLSRQVNVAATLDLIDMAASQGTSPRFVFASTIAVFGSPFPVEGVDDETPAMPRMIYGMHKLMTEIAVATMSRRGAIDGVCLRLPGIVARPPGPSGMKSAFMSDIFHALREGRPYTLPVSPQAQLWLMSVSRCALNLCTALTLDSSRMPEQRVATLPALRVSVADLVEAVAQASDTPTGRIAYQPDAALEAAFGAHPTLATPAAERVGMVHDGTLSELVDNALATISRSVT